MACVGRMGIERGADVEEEEKHVMDAVLFDCTVYICAMMYVFVMKC